MEWLLILPVILIAILTYLLLAPFYLEVDSTKGLLGIRFHRLAAAQLVIKDDSLRIDLSIAGWRKQIDPLADGRRRDKPPATKREKSKSSISWGMIKAVAKSFKVNKCYLVIDTGNMPWNGILYPAFYWLSRLTGKTFEINFSGESEIALEIENNFARIIKAIILHLFTIKKQKHEQLK